ncbi:MAG: hypothetical protein M3R31_00900 [Pseudomonadota bacterium]|nr:hypothetical protein [Pseudomonadota bacterium]
MTGSAPRATSIRCALILCALLFACTGTPTFPPAAPGTGKRSPPAEREFRTSDIAKADIDIAAEVHSRECLASARVLMEKLYRRNPREWRKGNYPSMDAALARAFDARSEFQFAELGNARGADAIILALKPEYAGDRVFAFGVGLASMVFLAYNGKTEFYLTDSFDPQKLYNSARNIEIAAWKLANGRDARGEPLLLSNEIAGDARNLSFEREFGKMIAYQDVMAQIAAQRTNRIIRRVVQSLATAVFLPI